LISFRYQIYIRSFTFQNDIFAERHFMRSLLFAILLVLGFDALAGTADSISVFSKAMHKNVPCMVIKPVTLKKNGGRIPVVYLLHGYSGNHRQWLNDAPQLLALADIYNILIVCPDGGFSSWYFDSPIDSTVRYETFITSELIQAIDKNYPTIPGKKGRAISGLSMGGHGGLFLAARHHEIFGAAGSMAGGVNLRPFPNQWDISKRIGDTACCEENWKKYSVINNVDSLKNKDLTLIIDCGVSDFFLEVNRELHLKLLNMKIDHDYIERPGGHNKDYWGNSVNYQLMFFDKYFRASKQTKAG
jgi:S-formylglutathione hydrolase FrmB